ncbi:inorganic pyrophosphatase/exopolyphosphatase [Clostridium aceticum]|uniref:inorganic diphosphatase n=1 Tax=Clostridium aceticum TaxID=84022 RepID=A0A0D8I7Y6_9CLOT|nr:putative manganese-dependent inorganic diphosphatase [Clostridium aceticum]AKL97153.1 inorganic pyrophosphatase/exopolyphosphatase [Clostridium aceticum]KJF26194.1 inorganic pyrophosphatase [Clostridium aceticum]
MSIFVFGHKNPDTDSVSSAIAFSHLKNKLGFDTIPCVLGEVNKETSYVLNYFGLPTPKLIDNVKVQVKDLKYSFDEGVSGDNCILSIYKLMEKEQLQTVAVVDENHKLLGIVSMKDIAMGLIKGDFYHLQSSLENLVAALKGEVLTGDRDYFDGKISVITYYYKTIAGSLGEEDIIIVGDTYDVIESAIQSKVQLIVITGGKVLPEKYIAMAQEKKVTLLSVPMDTYYVSKVINQCNDVSTIMRTKNIIKFYEEDYLEEIKEEIINTHFRNYPIVDHQNTFLGFINKKHILNPQRKKTILVDHNEYRQSAEGLEESEILEIVDHHKLGDISTSMPINFRNNAVGSTCTIVYWMFRDFNIEIHKAMAGVLMAGIISDTLLFKSPTTTDMDRRAVEELNKILHMDIETFAMEMFKTGTSLEGQSIEQIFYKDFKEFNLETYKTGISQVFTLDIEDVFNRKDSFIDFMERTHKNNNYDITLLLITDILKEGSYILFQCKNNHLISSAFHVEGLQGIFVENIVSRKKQVIPRLLEAIHLIK